MSPTTSRSASPSPSAAMTLPGDVPLKVQSVRPEEPEEPAWFQSVQSLAPFVVGMLFLMALGLWQRYILPHSYQLPINLAPEIPGLAVSLSYPTYVAVGDEGYLDVMVTGRSAEPATGRLVVVFTAPPSAQTLPESTNLIEFSALRDGQQLAQRVRFGLNQWPWAWHVGTVKFQVQAMTEDGREKLMAEHNIALAPLPYLKTILFGSFGLTALGGIFWDYIRRRFLSWQGK